MGSFWIYWFPLFHQYGKCSITSDQPKVGIPAFLLLSRRLHLPSLNMFLHKNDMCPKRQSHLIGMWKIVQLYQLSIKQKWKGTYTRNIKKHICLKSCNPAAFVRQGDIPTLQEFIARGKGRMHTMWETHKTHTDNDSLIDFDALHSSSQASHHCYRHHRDRRHQSSWWVNACYIIVI